MVDQIFLLSNVEYLLLAAAAGIQETYGFDMNADRVVRSESLNGMQGLVEKGFLVNEDDTFRLTGSMKEIFDVIREADTILDVHKKSGKKCIYYIGDHAVKICRSLRRQNKYQLTLLRVSDVWKDLKEEGWLREKGKEKDYDLS